jgi:hypothetical protein
MRATTPLRIKGNGAIVPQQRRSSSMMAATPLLQGQRCQNHDYNLDYGKDTITTRVTIAIAMIAKTPAHQRQQCHRYKGNKIIAMTVRTSAHQ